MKNYKTLSFYGMNLGLTVSVDFLAEVGKNLKISKLSVFQVPILNRFVVEGSLSTNILGFFEILNLRPKFVKTALTIFLMTFS